MSRLAVLPPSPVAYGPAWHARGAWADVFRAAGARCCYCDREIAVPASVKKLTVACIYCGMERGAVPAIDEPCYTESFEAPRHRPNIGVPRKSESGRRE